MSGKIEPVIPIDNTVCVDFDGTLFRWGPLMDKTDPFPGAIEAMREFKKAGFEIIIMTSRMSPTWWERAGFDFQEAMSVQGGWVRSRLDAYGIPYDRITAEKVPAEFYIDDKAIEFEGNDWSWRDIQARVLKGR